MPDAPANFGKITVQELKGLNEREQHANLDLGFFDVLKGTIPVNQNTVTKAPGIKHLLTMEGLETGTDKAVLSICQTNDSRQNMIIQLRGAVVVMSESEFFGVAASTPDLIPIPTTENEEDMPYALILHNTTQAAEGGTYTTANTWQTAPLNSTVTTQENPDGTGASFCSMGANTFDLDAGVYRIRGWSMMSSATAGRLVACRLFNVSDAVPAWNGADNEEGSSNLVAAVNENVRCDFAGTLNLVAGTTVFRVEGIMSASQANSGFGKTKYSAAGPTFDVMQYNTFRQIEIWKTA